MYRAINGAFRLLSEKGPVLIVAPWCDHFGDIGETVQFALLRGRIEGKRVALLFPRLRLFGPFRQARHYNPALFDVRSELRLGSWGHPASVLAGIALSLAYGLMKGAYLAMRKLRRELLPRLGAPPPEAFHTWYLAPTIGRDTTWSPVGARAFRWQDLDLGAWARALEAPLGVRLAPDVLHRGEEALRRMGIPGGAWFVCLHVREGSTYKDDAAYAHRNARIANYIPAIRAIAAAGGWVVRIGDPTMTPLPPLERVVDYVHTPFRSPETDVYLLSRCRYFIGGDSGVNQVARLFERRELLVNIVDFVGHYPLRKGDLGIYKHVYSRRLGRYLSLREVLEEPLRCQLKPDAAGCELVENSPEEILAAVRELLAGPAEDALSAAQESFHEARLRAARRWLERDRLNLNHPEQEVVEQYRKAVCGSIATGSLCRGYAESNWLSNSRNGRASVP